MFGETKTKIHLLDLNTIHFRTQAIEVAILQPDQHNKRILLNSQHRLKDYKISREKKAKYRTIKKTFFDSLI